MKYIGTYSNDTDIATKAKVDAKQDKVLANGILQGDGAGTISAAETQEVELVELTKADVGLGNVDNTSDANKPISAATQAALNGKQDTITGGASTITSSNLTANLALVSDASGKVAVSEVTSTELGYLDGVTSNIQTQLDSKLSTAPVTSVNSKTGAVELSASDVNAVGLEGDQIIAGNKTFSGETTFDLGFMANGSSFTGGCIFKGQQVFNDGMVVDGQTYYEENSYISGKIRYDEGSTVDFTNAIVTGLKGLPPSVTASDNGKFLRVVNGAWAATTVENANGVSF